MSTGQQSLRGTKRRRDRKQRPEWGPELQLQTLDGRVGKRDFVKATHRVNFLFSVIFVSPKIAIWVFPFIWIVRDNWRFTCSCEKRYWAMSHTLCPVSPKGDILQNYSIKSQPGYWHCYNPPSSDYLSATCAPVCARVCVCAHALFGSSFYLHASAEIFHLSQEGSPLILRRLRYILWKPDNCSSQGWHLWLPFSFRAVEIFPVFHI